MAVELKSVCNLSEDQRRLVEATVAEITQQVDQLAQKVDLARRHYEDIIKDAELSRTLREVGAAKKADCESKMDAFAELVSKDATLAMAVSAHPFIEAYGTMNPSHPSLAAFSGQFKGLGFTDKVCVEDDYVCKGEEQAKSVQGLYRWARSVLEFRLPLKKNLAKEAGVTIAALLTSSALWEDSAANFDRVVPKLVDSSFSDKKAECDDPRKSAKAECEELLKMRPDEVGERDVHVVTMVLKSMMKKLYAIFRLNFHEEYTEFVVADTLKNHPGTLHSVATLVMHVLHETRGTFAGAGDLADDLLYGMAHTHCAGQFFSSAPTPVAVNKILGLADNTRGPRECETRFQRVAQKSLEQHLEAYVEKARAEATGIAKAFQWPSDKSDLDDFDYDWHQSDDDHGHHGSDGLDDGSAPMAAPEHPAVRSSVASSESARRRLAGDAKQDRIKAVEERAAAIKVSATKAITGKTKATRNNRNETNLAQPQSSGSEAAVDDSTWWIWLLVAVAAASVGVAAYCFIAKRKQAARVAEIDMVLRA